MPVTPPHALLVIKKSCNDCDLPVGEVTQSLQCLRIRTQYSVSEINRPSQPSARAPEIQETERRSQAPTPTSSVHGARGDDHEQTQTERHRTEFLRQHFNWQLRNSIRQQGRVHDGGEWLEGPPMEVELAAVAASGTIVILLIGCTWCVHLLLSD